MSCRTHPSNPGTGVCARCLRERLSALGVSAVEDDAMPSQKIRKKPVAADSTCGGGKKRSAVKSSILSPLKSNQMSEKIEIDAVVLKPLASNFSLLALILRQRIKNKKKSSNIAPEEEDVSFERSSKLHEPAVNAKGMSPASNDETEDDGCDLSTPSPLRHKVVAMQPHHTEKRHNPYGVSSFALCLNPLVRPCPGTRRSHCPSQRVSSKQLRGTFARRFSDSGAAFTDSSPSLVPNRSRKLVDLGKVW